MNFAKIEYKNTLGNFVEVGAICKKNGWRYTENPSSSIMGETRLAYIECADTQLVENALKNYMV